MPGLSLRPRALTALLCVAAGLVSGCGAGHHDGASSAPAANDTDMAFVTDMAAHHEGAIEMAQLARTRAEHPQIKALAAEIIRAQKAEIATMRSIGEEMHGDGAMHHGDGAHMGMTDAEMGMNMDMGALARARPFDRAFIDAMVLHHRGAVRMARELQDEGEDPELQRLAGAIVRTQTREMKRMQAWRRAWYGAA